MKIIKPQAQTVHPSKLLVRSFVWDMDRLGHTVFWNLQGLQRDALTLPSNFPINNIIKSRLCSWTREKLCEEIWAGESVNGSKWVVVEWQTDGFAWNATVTFQDKISSCKLILSQTEITHTWQCGSVIDLKSVWGSYILNKEQERERNQFQH